MKQIELTHGKQAVVDDDDYESLSRFKWRAVHLGNTDYAISSQNHPVFGRLKRRIVLMHRVIMGIDGSAEPLVDHIDHDGLNNRRDNLRLVTKRENAQNRRIRGSSAYIGVSWIKASKKWKADIWDGQGKKHLGFYDNESDAARAYDNALVELGLSPVNFKCD